MTIKINIESWELAEQIAQRNAKKGYRSMSESEIDALAGFLEEIGDLDSDLHCIADNYGINGEFADYNLETKESDYLGKKATDEQIEKWESDCLFEWEEDGIRSK